MSGICYDHHPLAVSLYDSTTLTCKYHAQMVCSLFDKSKPIVKQSQQNNGKSGLIVRARRTVMNKDSCACRCNGLDSESAKDNYC